MASELATDNWDATVIVAPPVSIGMSLFVPTMLVLTVTGKIQ
jgi:hypothetical protein